MTVPEKNHFNRSQVLLDRGRYDLAEQELRKEIAINPDFADAYALLGLCLINQKKFSLDLIFLFDRQQVILAMIGYLYTFLVLTSPLVAIRLDGTGHL